MVDVQGRFEALLGRTGGVEGERCPIFGLCAATMMRRAEELLFTLINSTLNHFCCLLLSSLRTTWWVPEPQFDPQIWLPQQGLCLGGAHLTGWSQGSVLPFTRF